MKKIIKVIVSLLGVLAGGATILHFGKEYINDKTNREGSDKNKC